jgi:hypothetical protein
VCGDSWMKIIASSASNQADAVSGGDPCEFSAQGIESKFEPSSRGSRLGWTSAQTRGKECDRSFPRPDDFKMQAQLRKDTRIAR